MFQAKVKLVEPVKYNFKDEGKVYEGFKITIDGDDGKYIRFHSSVAVKEGDTIKVGVRQYGNKTTCYLVTD